jgi:hypothetical protein
VCRQMAFGDTGLGLDNASFEPNGTMGNELFFEKQIERPYPQPHMVASTLCLHASRKLKRQIRRF